MLIKNSKIEVMLEANVASSIAKSILKIVASMANKYGNTTVFAVFVFWLKLTAFKLVGIILKHITSKGLDVTALTLNQIHKIASHSADVILKKGNTAKKKPEKNRLKDFKSSYNKFLGRHRILKSIEPIIITYIYLITVSLILKRVATKDSKLDKTGKALFNVATSEFRGLTNIVRKKLIRILEKRTNQSMGTAKPINVKNWS